MASPPTMGDCKDADVHMTGFVASSGQGGAPTYFNHEGFLEAIHRPLLHYGEGIPVPIVFWGTGHAVVDQPVHLDGMGIPVASLGAEHMALNCPGFFHAAGLPVAL